MSKLVVVHWFFFVVHALVDTFHEDDDGVGHAEAVGEEFPVLAFQDHEVLVSEFC